MIKKGLILTVLLQLLAINMIAQSSHMKFMGIPINGTISQFQTKLISKGFTYDQRASSLIKSPTRIFNGYFAGENSQLYVYYNERNKVVYEVKVAMSYLNKDTAEEHYNKLKSMFDEKYYQEYRYEDNSTFDESVYNVYTNEGFIQFYVMYNQYDDNMPYKVHIDYYDDVNYNANKKSIIDDI